MFRSWDKKMILQCLVLLLQSTMIMMVLGNTNPNVTWSGCGPLGSETQKLTMDKNTVICLQVANTLDWGNGGKYLRLSFQPKVDQYSRFHVVNCT